MTSERLADSSSLTLPPIPSGWTYVEIENLLESNALAYGIVQPGSDVADGVPILRVKNLAKNGINTDDVLRVSGDIERQYRRSRLEGGEVLLSLVGTVGLVTVAPPELAGWNVARAIAVMRVVDGANRWLKYYLSSDVAQHHMHVWQTTTVQATLNLRDVRRLPVAMPPASEREAIVALLQALDDKIAVNDRLVNISSELINAQYDRCLSSATGTLKLGQAVDFDFGSPFSSDYFNEKHEGIPLLRIRDLKTWRPGIWTTERLPGDIVIEPGDVVAGMDAEFRPTFWLGKPALLNQRVLRARPRLLGGGKTFVREVLRAPLLEIERHKTGTTVIHLNKRDLDSAIVQVPTTKSLQDFETIADPLRAKLVSTAHESAVLTELRDTLLPRLMLGQIRVREAERIVEDAT